MGDENNFAQGAKFGKAGSDNNNPAFQVPEPGAARKTSNGSITKLRSWYSSAPDLDDSKVRFTTL